MKKYMKMKSFLSRKEQWLIGTLLCALFLLAGIGTYYVHFVYPREEKREEKKGYDLGDQIRVVISTTDFSDIFHEEVLLSANADWYMEGEEVCYEKGESWKASSFFAEHPEISKCTFCVIEDQETNSGIQIDSIQREYGKPVYEGTIEVQNTTQGYVIVNTVSLETYLRYVVPSEMPASFGIEPLKAQAICARNYGYRHMQAPAYIDLEGDLDDSIRYQVYNNCKTNLLTDQAIASTKGQLLLYQESVIDTYYYSTSWGFTTDLSLWGTENFPYYVSHWQGEGDRQPDLTKESVFAQTLEEEQGAYEASEPWYRWSTTIPKERILENLNQLELVQLDRLTDVVISKRRTGGSVQEMIFMGEGGTVVLGKESEIRKAFQPKTEDVYKNDGTVVHGYEKLPSSFFTIEKNFQGGELVSVTVKGGGCGHGVGMSQNCAKALGEQGKNYQEILQYFFPGTRVGSLGF